MLCFCGVGGSEFFYFVLFVVSSESEVFTWELLLPTDVLNESLQKIAINVRYGSQMGHLIIYDMAIIYCLVYILPQLCFVCVFPT